MEVVAALRLLQWRLRRLSGTPAWHLSTLSQDSEAQVTYDYNQPIPLGIRNETGDSCFLSSFLQALFCLHGIEWESSANETSTSLKNFKDIIYSRTESSETGAIAGIGELRQTLFPESDSLRENQNDPSEVLDRLFGSQQEVREKGVISWVEGKLPLGLIRNFKVNLNQPSRGEGEHADRRHIGDVYTVNVYPTESLLEVTPRLTIYLQETTHLAFRINRIYFDIEEEKPILTALNKTYFYDPLVINGATFYVASFVTGTHGTGPANINFGHYAAYVRAWTSREDSQWYEVDGTDVEPIDEERASEKYIEANILFFQKTPPN